MRKAVAYYRVSTDRQGRSGLGLAAQKKMVREYCKANGIILVKEYLEVKSGENHEKRPKVQESVKYCVKHDVLLIVAKQSRLARNVWFIADLIKRGIQFISVENPGANNLQKYIQAAFDENYLEETRSNTKQSLEAAVRKGVKLGGNNKKLKRTLKRKRKAHLKWIKPKVRQIQKEGFTTIRAITEQLNHRKIKTVRGNSIWHLSTVHQLMHDL